MAKVTLLQFETIFDKVNIKHFLRIKCRANQTLTNYALFGNYFYNWTFRYRSEAQNYSSTNAGSLAATTYTKANGEVFYIDIFPNDLQLLSDHIIDTIFRKNEHFNAIQVDTYDINEFDKADGEPLVIESAYSKIFEKPNNTNIFKSMIQKEDLINLAASILGVEAEKIYCETRKLDLNNTGINTKLLNDNSNRKQFIWILQGYVNVTVTGTTDTLSILDSTNADAVLFQIPTGLTGGFVFSDIAGDKLSLNGSFKGQLIYHRFISKT